MSHIKRASYTSLSKRPVSQKIILSYLLIFALFSSPFTQAQIFKYRKPNGKLLFTDTQIFKKDYVLLSPKQRAYRPYRVKAGNPSTFQIDITYASLNYGVDESLIKAIIKTESNFDANAVSTAGAVGLMQLMPKTAAAYHVSNSYDGRQNIIAGTKHIKYLLDRYKGNLDLALAAYNAGETNVRKYGGIPPFKETERYVKKVKHFKRKFDG